MKLPFARPDDVGDAGLMVLVGAMILFLLVAAVGVFALVAEHPARSFSMLALFGLCYLVGSFAKWLVTRSDAS